MSQVAIVSGPDVGSLRDRLLASLNTAGLSSSLAPCALPESWELAVVLALLSPALQGDRDLVAFLEEASRRGFPVIPVVEDLATYDFKAAPLASLSKINAVGWSPGDGQAVLQAVRGYLGQEAFPEKKKVFLSYRRSDGQAIADRLYKDLWDHQFEAFLDLYQIEPGAEVQETILSRLTDMDFVLLLDTPEARGSTWVRDEIVGALARRIQVRVLSFGQPTRYPLLADVEHLPWDDSDPHMLDRVRALISRGIGATASFDERVGRVVAAALSIKGLRLRERARRQIVLTRRGERLLLEYEPGRPTLERLHRLHQGYVATNRPPALLVSGEEPILEVTRNAIDWASGRAPLEVVPLIDLYTALDRYFPGI